MTMEIGGKHSPETRRKMAASSRARWARERGETPLSRRQLQALTMCAEGCSIYKISSVMDILPKTVESLLYQAARRLGTTGPDARGDTLAEARRLGLIPEVQYRPRSRVFPSAQPRYDFDDYVPGASNQGRSGKYVRP